MRRFFDYDFDGLKLEDADTYDSIFTSALSFLTFPDIVAAAPSEGPLFADIDGTPGDDTLNGTAAADVINGLGGDDFINGGEGADIIDGGDGFDTLSFEGETQGINVFYSSASDVTNVSTPTGTDSFTNIERIIGGSGDDRFITLDANSNEVFHFEGGDGDDQFRGSAGDDIFIGGNGDDFVIGRRGNDTFDGGAGSDRLSTFSMGLSLNPTQAYSADLALGQVLDNGFGEVVTLINVEGLSGGTFFADTFLGDENDNVIFGNLGGADLVDGRGGDDLLWLVSATGTVIGGAGIDTFSLLSSRFIQGTFDEQSIFQGVEIDLVMGTMLDGFNEGGGSISGIENFEGSFYSDVLIGDGNDNVILVFGGQDFADGGAGIDTISYNPAFGSTEAVNVDLTAGTAVQDVIKVNVLSPAALDPAFLSDALNGDLNLTITTNNFGGGEVYGVVRDVESDVTDGSGIRTVTFSPFGLDGYQDAGFNNVSFSSAVAEVRLVMIVDAAGALTYTLDISVQGIQITDILQVILNSVNSPLLVDVVTDSGGTIAMGTETSTLLNFENIFGSSFDDMLTGDAGDNEITGGSGDDVIDGASGNDIAIFSGNHSNYSIVNNGDGTFTITDNVGADGQDTLSNIEFAQFADTSVDLSTIAPPINGTPGNDNLMGTSGDDVINGLEGNDIIDGLAGDDVLNGGDGADRLIGGLGADELNGGAGFDSADYRGATTGVRFVVETGGTVGEAAGDTFSEIERYYLSDFNDIVTGSDANEFFYGEDGNDQINGGGGIDRIYGGEGNDIQRGQDGNDTLYGSAGADQLNGGTGFDVANYSFAAAAVSVNMLTGGTGGDAAGDTYFGVEAVYGSNFNDSLTGNNSANELRGGDGDDMLFGLGGNDRFFGGAGADSFDGGAGIDTVSYTNATEGITVFLFQPGTSGDADGDTFTSIEWVFGTNFSDVIFGDDGNNRLEGRNGNDQLFGREGNDRLLGGDGNDTIHGEEGVDTIFGQDGDDMMFGGAGNDFFFGGAGADSHDGGSGVDTVSYLASSSGVIVNMQTGGTGGDATGDTYTNIERIFGTSFDDSLRGSVDDDILLGNGGSDFLDGGMGGNDTLIGGAGIDSFGFSATDGGSDVISGFFAANEVIYIYDTFGGENGPEDFAGLLSIASNAGANTIFSFSNGSTLTLTGINIADLSASNFDFSGMLPAGEPLDDLDAFAADPIDVFDMDALI